MICAKIRDRGISTRNARHIRMGIATGELIYNFLVKDDIAAARLALIKASKAPKRIYLAALHTVRKRMSCNRDQVML